MAVSAPDLPLDLLSRSALFGSLSRDDRTAIVAAMRPAQFKAGELIFSRGDDADGLYMLRAGGVRLSVLTGDGRELSFSHASVGSVFGEIATLDGGPRTAEATALTSVTALFLSRGSLKTLIERHPRIADAVIHFLCARLRETDHKLEAIALYSIEVRLARFLLSAVDAQEPGTERSHVTVTLGISQSEIGLLIGASRPKVNAALALLESERALRREGADMICHLPTLRRLADQED